MTTKLTPTKTRSVIVWGAVVTALGVPLLAAAFSPLLAWRQAIYVIAGFAGVIGLAILLLQPLLVLGALPGLGSAKSRRLHKILGLILVGSVLVHVIGLWITSPPDVIDALLIVSPTPFSAWGVIAMWSVLLAAALALWRRRVRLSWRTWRSFHKALAFVTVCGTVAHALMIEGTMETLSKTALCFFVFVAMLRAVVPDRPARR